MKLDRRHLSKNELLRKIIAQEKEMQSLRTTIAIQRAFIRQSLGRDMDKDLKDIAKPIFDRED